VRGVGVFWGIDMVSNQSTREPLAPYGSSSPKMNEIVATCKKNGLMPFNNFNRIHLVPPCNVSEEEAQTGVEIFSNSLTELGL
jgi:taurine--2-oxoglutarate transaminase